jgi:cytoskeletal protein RodZ
MASERQKADVGARLRDAREKRGLSLRVIADTTRISVRLLEALERNDISRLPGGIFSRAFVRAYAREVGLDPEQTIAEFITQFPDDSVTQGHPRTRTIVDELDGNSRSGPGVTWGRAGVVAVVLILIIGFALFARRSRFEQVAASAAAVDQHPASATDRLAVTVQASRTCTVTVTADGGSPREVQAAAGTLLTFAADRELLLTSSDPAALQWSINGQPARGMTGPVRVTAATMHDFLDTP